MKKLIIVAIAALTAACQTIPTSGTVTPSGPPTIPSGALDLGDYRRDNANAVIQNFEQNVNRRYGAGLELSAVVADLRRNQFNCAAAPASTRGDPPAQICRRTVTESGCTHTWQVHLYGAPADVSDLARTRSLYDKRCGGDGLLGGPT